MAEDGVRGIFEERWFEEYLAAYEIRNIIYPNRAQIEAYRGKLPDYLLQFWADHGWCSWSDGQYWLCDPALPKPVLDYVFRSDPEFDPEKMFAFGYTAFGEIDIWYGDATIRLHLLMNKVRVEPREYDLEHQRYWTDEIMLGLRFMGRFAPVTPPWEDDDYQNMMPEAVKRLGRLDWGEIYGFVPALSLGGPNSVDHLQKMPLVEHLTFLASVEPPILYDYEPPAVGEAGFGTATPVRPVGPQP
ncbi:GAD-like domain-containing protein [Fulvimarina sp. MAC8]|uniref:GAD-like domain-containing protein n=1 Tax=Fulvimarina sp. MAC8 TaxID=3162874 RepID=UPI0032EF3054